MASKSASPPEFSRRETLLQPDVIDPSSWWKKWLYPIFMGTLLVPLLIFLHEGGHYVIALAYEVNPTFHLREIRFKSHPEISNQAMFWTCAGGPLLDTLLATSSFFWLRNKRRPRTDTPPTFTDCLGIVLVVHHALIYAFIFVVHLMLQDFLKKPGDAEKMSLLMELPVWLVPALLASFSLVLIVASIRLFPRRYRLVPFACAVLGWFAGWFMQDFYSGLWDRFFS